jgi:hypothetical protein
LDDAVMAVRLNSSRQLTGLLTHMMPLDNRTYLLKEELQTAYMMLGFDIDVEERANSNSEESEFNLGMHDDDAVVWNYVFFPQTPSQETLEVTFPHAPYVVLLSYRLFQSAYYGYVRKMWGTAPGSLAHLGLLNPAYGEAVEQVPAEQMTDVVGMLMAGRRGGMITLEAMASRDALTEDTLTVSEADEKFGGGRKDSPGYAMQYQIVTEMLRKGYSQLPRSSDNEALYFRRPANKVYDLAILTYFGALWLDGALQTAVHAQATLADCLREDVRASLLRADLLAHTTGSFAAYPLICSYVAGVLDPNDPHRAPLRTGHMPPPMSVTLGVGTTRSDPDTALYSWKWTKLSADYDERWHATDRSGKFGTPDNVRAMAAMIAALCVNADADADAQAPSLDALTLSEASQILRAKLQFVLSNQIQPEARNAPLHRHAEAVVTQLLDPDTRVFAFGVIDNMPLWARMALCAKVMSPTLERSYALPRLEASRSWESLDQLHACVVGVVCLRQQRVVATLPEDLLSASADWAVSKEALGRRHLQLMHGVEAFNRRCVSMAGILRSRSYEERYGEQPSRRMRTTASDAEDEHDASRAEDAEALRPLATPSADGGGGGGGDDNEDDDMFA